MKRPKRLERMIKGMVSSHVWKHNCRWGQSQVDIEQAALEAVWESGARTPDAAKRAIRKALDDARDTSKANRSRLEPYTARKAADDSAKQKAFEAFNEDFALKGEESSRRELDRLRVKLALRTMSAADHEFVKNYKLYGSVTKMAQAKKIPLTTFRREVWDGFKTRLIAALEKVDVEILARLYISNPNVFAGR